MYRQQHRNIMPPKPTTSGAGSFGGDADLEVVCPLANQDGSQCRKRCIGVCYPITMTYTSKQLTTCATGKALPLHAGAYSTRPPELLHPKTASNRGEFSVNDQYTSFRATTTTTHDNHSFSEGSLYVCGRVATESDGLRHEQQI